MALQRPNGQPLGQPLKLSAEDLTLAAEVTPVDVMLARALWTRASPLRFIDLLDAVPVATENRS